jgi:hypothetical protein
VTDRMRVTLEIGPKAKKVAAAGEIGITSSVTRLITPGKWKTKIRRSNKREIERKEELSSVPAYQRRSTRGSRLVGLHYGAEV